MEQTQSKSIKWVVFLHWSYLPAGWDYNGSNSTGLLQDDYRIIGQMMEKPWPKLS